MNFLRFVVRLAMKRIIEFFHSLRFYSFSAPNVIENLIDRMESESNGAKD